MKKKILWVYILFLRKYADKFCVDNACCVMIMDTFCHLTDVVSLNQLLEGGTKQRDKMAFPGTEWQKKQNDWDSKAGGKGLGSERSIGS